MSRILNPCGEYRKNLCLLACRGLSSAPAAVILTRGRETPLQAACADCRKYYEEIQRVSVPLANWEQNFTQVEPSQAALARWEKHFAAATAPASPARFALIFSILDWVHDMIWPCRRIWAGLAAVWLVIIGINSSTRESFQTLAGGTSRPPFEMVRAYLEAEGFAAEWAGPDRSRVAEPSKPSLPPPRSERRPQNVRI